MKKMTYALHSVAALAVAALATACSSEDELTSPSGNKAPVTITAYQPNTRVYYDGGGVGYWQAGDKIGVILCNATGNGTFTAEEFTISSGEGKTKATFTGNPSNDDTIDPRYAMYPYNSGHKYEWSGMVLSGDASYTYVLPSSYTYTKVDQDYSRADGNSFCMPMFGTISSNAVTFKNIGGVICMKIDQMPAASGTVTMKEASNQLCGSFTIANVGAGDPSISTSASTSDNTVTFTYEGATAGKPGVFYLPVATGTYTLTVTVAGEGAESKAVTTDALNITRSKLKKVSITLGSKDNSKEINGHKFVDLGLPSGLLWAETNIGAETAADDGDYFAWGETKKKDAYSWDTYSFGTQNAVTKYNSSDNKTSLDSDNDAAYVNWSEYCRMPTHDEFVELSDNCIWTWTSKTNSSNQSISGYVVTSKTNSNAIFLPASGSYTQSGLSVYNEHGYYWSSTLYLNDGNGSYACDLRFSEGGNVLTQYYNHRAYGYPVRPVAEP